MHIIKNIINEKQIIVNSYGFYSQFYFYNKTNKQKKNYIIFKINSENIYIYFEEQFKNKKIYYKENILTKYELIKELKKVKELKFILDYINKQ